MDSKNGSKKQTKKGQQSEAESSTMRALGPIESSSNGGNCLLYDAANIVPLTRRVPPARNDAEDLYMQLDPAENTNQTESKKASPPPKKDPAEETNKRKSLKPHNTKDSAPVPRKRRNSEILPGYHYIIFLLSGLFYWVFAIYAVRFYKAYFPAGEPED